MTNHSSSPGPELYISLKIEAVRFNRASKCKDGSVFFSHLSWKLPFPEIIYRICKSQGDLIKVASEFAHEEVGNGNQNLFQPWCIMKITLMNGDIEDVIFDESNNPKENW